MLILRLKHDVCGGGSTGGRQAGGRAEDDGLIGRQLAEEGWRRRGKESCRMRGLRRVATWLR